MGKSVIATKNSKIVTGILALAAAIKVLIVVLSLAAAVTTAFPLTTKNAGTTTQAVSRSPALVFLLPPSERTRRRSLFLASEPVVAAPKKNDNNSNPSTAVGSSSKSNTKKNNKNNTKKNNKSDNKNVNQTKQQSKKAATVISVETYTNHWDNLLLEEHRLALDEWRDRKSKCSLETLENRGLVITRAFALPDSEVLGEKTVRIHNGSGGSTDKKSTRGMIDGSILGDGFDEFDDGRGATRNKKNKNDRRRFRKPWNELFSRGDILEMTANGAGGFDSMIGGGGFSSQAFRRECLVMDVGDTWMLVGVGKSWPLGIWDARKGGSSSGNGKFGRSSSDPSYGYPVRLDKTPNAAALIPLRAQRSALQTVREQQQGKQQHETQTTIATWLTKTTKEHCKGYHQLRNKQKWARKMPHHFRVMIHEYCDTNKNSEGEEKEEFLATHLSEAIEMVTGRRSLLSSSSNRKNWSATANKSQRQAIVWALSRRVSSIQGPPGTGKTRVAALLIATALEMARATNEKAAAATTGDDDDTAGRRRPFRVLAVAHSNGAADVHLEALLELGVPAVRAGRPAAISARVRHRSAVALAEKIPQVVRLRKELIAASTRNTRNSNYNARNNIEWELQKCIQDAQDALLDSAPVVVTSCVGAHQLSVRQDKLREGENQRRQQQRLQGHPQESRLTEDTKEDDSRFPLVVLDEAAQCTEPALVCALVAARAEQLVMVGDTKQLPPTVASSSKELRESLAISPMERLEKSGLVEQTILRVQYRMVQALLDHPSKYFYNGLVKSATKQRSEATNIDTISGAFAPEADSTLGAPLPTGFTWPNPSLPLAFIGVGKGDSEVLHDSSLGLAGRSNPTEAKWVARIVADILEEGELRASQVCVLTPYSKQVSVIRSILEKESLLRRYERRNENKDDETLTGVSSATFTSTAAATSVLRSINDVRVGTVDSFQGQETEVVIFSAVRSNNFSELGFLRDPRRLCVALTRARKGLIILGDSGVLNSCRHWRSLIQSCRDRNCLVDENNFRLLLSSNGTQGAKDSNNEDQRDVELGGDGIVEGIRVDDTSSENNKSMIEREKLSQLDPEKEFFGLFSKPNSSKKG